MRAYDNAMGTTAIHFLALAVLSVLLVACSASNGGGAPSAVSRKPLLDVHLNPAQPVATAKVQSITLAPGTKVPRHMHPCPTIGVVNQGSILFQVEGREEQHLKAGDAFYEPAGVAIAHFDNEGDTPASFIVYYLLGPEETETIRMLPK